MKDYDVSISRRAQKELAKLPDHAYQSVRGAVRALAQNPRPPGSIKLTNRAAWRIRVGDYRVIYEIHDQQLVVIVVHVGHRRDIYR